MAITEIKGKKFWQIDLGTSGGNYEMTQDFKLLEVRLTGIVDGDYMTFYEAYGDNPRIFKLDFDRAATFFQGALTTRLGFYWDECSITTPASAILSIEME